MVPPQQNPCLPFLLAFAAACAAPEPATGPSGSGDARAGEVAEDAPVAEAAAATGRGAASGQDAASEEPAEQEPRDYAETIRGSEVSFGMVWIPAGGFWIGRTEVTWDEFLLYCDFDGDGAPPPGADAVSKPSKTLDWTPYDRDWGAGRRPAVGISWNAARKYCEWLTLNTGREYRLPTEEEWQLACGTGGEGELADRAWFDENSEEMTQEVGRLAANEHGLHDVLGNLWEYAANPFDPAEPERAVLRGGSWQDPAGTLKPASRLAFDDDWTLDDPNFPPGVWWVPDGGHLGMRVLRPGPEQ